MTVTAVDTSVAVPLLVASHSAHSVVSAWAQGRSLVLSGQALAETYSVLTRLPGGARVAPADAVTLIDSAFGGEGSAGGAAVALDDAVSGRAHRTLADRGISGGAVYDGLVGAAAHAHGLTLATRDARARGTYAAVGVGVEHVEA